MINLIKRVLHYFGIYTRAEKEAIDVYKDMLIYGQGYMQNGKRINPEDVYIKQARGLE